MLLQAQDLRKTYQSGDRSTEVLKGVSLSVDRGQFVSIMGPSGSGKSTLMHIIGGLDKPSAGSVKLEGQAIESYTDDQISAFRRRRLGFIFQFFNLLPTLTALENVALPLLVDGKPMSEVAPKAKELLALMKLDHRVNNLATELSGGEMQRVAIARALVTDPLLILADEPTGNLDTKTGTAVLELLATLVKERGQTILMVTHDPRAAAYGTRLVRIRDGLVESDGKPEPLSSHSTAH